MSCFRIFSLTEIIISDILTTKGGCFMHLNHLSYCFSIDNAHFRVSMLSDGVINYVIPGHSHAKDCYEIHCITDGNGSILLNNTRFPVAAGSIYVTGILRPRSPTTNFRCRPRASTSRCSRPTKAASADRSGSRWRPNTSRSTPGRATDSGSPISASTTPRARRRSTCEKSSYATTMFS